MGNSPTTGQQFYSGSWEDIKRVCSVLEIGNAKLSHITQELVEFYQETVDREIDGIASELYHVPFAKVNQYQPDGTTKSVFPGQLRRLSLYWTAGLLLINEFQQSDPNMSESATAYIEDSRRELFKIVKFNQRLFGQSVKSNISRTMPPTMQPPSQNEPDF